MHILAIDYGTKRIGLAWSDTTLGVVLPYGVVEGKREKGKGEREEGKGERQKVEELAELINSEKIDKIVVGFPVSLDSKENKNTERIKKFVFELQKHISADLEYFDERFSSQAADAVGEGVSRDERSAMIILQSYLERKKAGRL